MPRKKTLVFPTVAWEMVTIAKATEWLEKLNTHNRKKGESLADKYGRDRSLGHWVELSPLLISFDTDGVLLNGQHTLQAIINSDKPGWFLIGRGFDPRTRMVIDIGRMRTPADILKLLGYEASHHDVAVVRQIMNGMSRRASVPEIVDAYIIHEKAAKAVLAMFPHKVKNITKAPVAGPMARAWYTKEYRPHLPRFADILTTGLASKRYRGDRAAGMLREYLIVLPHVGEAMTREIYKMTETALYAFLNNERLEELLPTEEELFSLE